MADIERIVDWLIARVNGMRVPRSATGECWAGEQDVPMSVAWPDAGDTQRALLSELRLLFGIGPANAHKLRAAGFDSIRALLNHPRWGREAQELLASWRDPPQVKNIHQTLSYWLSPSHPLFLMLPSLVPPDKTCFFDLETLGLFGSPIFLAGVGRAGANGGLRVTQYLARELSEEVAVLDEVRRDLSTCMFLVTYNGKAFDWTCVRERCAYYALPNPPELLHLDLLSHTRRRFKNLFSDLRLETIEQELLGITRVDDLPSDAVPRYYTGYLNRDDPRLLIPILNHNRQDVITLASLFSYLVSHGTG